MRLFRLVPLLIAFSSTLLFSSCSVKLIEDEFPDFVKKPVINASLTPDSVMKVHLSYTANLSDTVMPPVTNAQVNIISDGGDMVNLNYEGKGYYTCNQKPIAGEGYTCHVTIPGLEEVTAHTKLPEPSHIISTEFTQKAGIDDNGMEYSSLKITFDNDLTQNRCYHVRLLYKSAYYNNIWNEDYIVIDPKNDTVFLAEAAPLYIFSNKKMTTTNPTITVNFSESDNLTAPYTLELRTADDSYYTYMKHLYLYQLGVSGGGFGQIPPAYNLYSNVKNGYGIFTSYSCEQKSIVFN